MNHRPDLAGLTAIPFFASLGCKRFTFFSLSPRELIEMPSSRMALSNVALELLSLHNFCHFAEGWKMSWLIYDEPHHRKVGQTKRVGSQFRDLALLVKEAFLKGWIFVELYGARREFINLCCHDKIFEKIVTLTNWNISYTFLYLSFRIDMRHKKV